MAVKIRLKRLGKIHAPFYRVVVADSRTRRDGRAIEEIGKYHPTEEPSLIEIDSERAQYWLGVGAQPTEQVLNLLKITGDWQTHKGEPGGEGTLRVKAAKADKKVAYEAAMRDAKAEPPAKKADKPRAEQAAETGRAPVTEKTDKAPEPEKAAASENAAEPEQPTATEQLAEPAAADVAAPAAEVPPTDALVDQAPAADESSTKDS